MATIRGRLRRAFGAATASGPEVASDSAPAPATQVDAAWILVDGSLCIDGWLADDVPGGPVDVRLIGSENGTWRPLLRKARPDVAEVLGLRAPDGSVAYGFVGHVDGSVEPGRPVTIEFRVGEATWEWRVSALADGVVPESVFSGLVLGAKALTPTGLAPIVDVIRQAPRPPAPQHRVVYEAFVGGPVPWLSVVVPLYGDFEYLRNLLLAISTDPVVGVELVLVSDDPALTPRLLAWLESWNDATFLLPLRLLAHDRNAGFAAACNTGWSAARGEKILLLNSDVLTNRPDTDLRTMAECLDDGCAAVAPVLLYPDGTVQHAGMLVEGSVDFPGFELPAHPGKHELPRDLGSAPRGVEMLSGAVLMTTATALKAVGGVPVVFGKGDFEDVLLSVSLREHGALVVHPGVVWTHVEGASYRREDHGGVPVTLAKSVVIGEQLGAAG